MYELCPIQELRSQERAKGREEASLAPPFLFLGSSAPGWDTIHRTPTLRRPCFRQVLYSKIWPRLDGIHCMYTVQYILSAYYREY